MGSPSEAVCILHLHGLRGREVVDLVPPCALRTRGCNLEEGLPAPANVATHAQHLLRRHGQEFVAVALL
eukprot:2079255-Alexandrium_andersonii.AAC.1